MTRRPDADVPPGLLLVDKAGGMTSHDVVARARRVLSVRKVGHAGTLDPMATGLLILGVGAAVTGFLPLSLLSAPLGWGLAGVWTGLVLFIALRLVGVLVRVAGDRWLSAPVSVSG